jgi:hypothetical protein
MVNLEAAPSFALGGLESFDEMEKLDRRRGPGLWTVRNSRENYN